MAIDEREAAKQACSEGSAAERSPAPAASEATEPVAPRGGSLLPYELPEIVDEASDESFPASDPPAWTPTKAA